VHGDKLKALLDSAAACEIMQTWLALPRNTLDQK
jgi:RNase H-fold protein (predicted Holliday junction resolvase)